MMKRVRIFSQAIGGLILATVFLAGCERPPVDAVQVGYRGTAMEQVDNPRLSKANAPENIMPKAAIPVAAAGGPMAADIYQNVQVLKDLNVAQFTRLMLNMSSWVAPEQGCNYCHEAGNLASDKLYTKVVARRMLQLTRHVNKEWKSHVKDTGVTCYTCHRGKNVPDQLLVKGPGNAAMANLAGNKDGQNSPTSRNVFSSLPIDDYLAYEEPIRVTGQTALPIRAAKGASIRATEGTFGLMTYLSSSLGVNCTHCHNSRAFDDWAQSPVQRTIAWHGIQMSRDLNKTYLLPLADTLPANRLGPQGDAPKVGCATCHNGQAKPLGGAAVLTEHPELNPSGG